MNVKINITGMLFFINDINNKAGYKIILSAK